MKETIAAKDTLGLSREIAVTLEKRDIQTKEDNSQYVLNFEDFMEIGMTGLLRMYPLQVGVCIDMRTQVIASADDVNKLLVLACEEIGIDINEYENKPTSSPTTTPPSTNEALEDLARKVRSSGEGEESDDE